MTKLVTTPRGIGRWVNLNKPDTKYKAEGTYSVKLALRLEDPGVEEFIAAAEAAREEEYQVQVKKLTDDKKPGLIKNLKKVDVYTVEEDRETGEPTGYILINAKMNASGISKKTGKPWSRRPVIANGRGEQLRNPPSMGAGSEFKLSVELRGYYSAKDKEIGCSYRLEGAKLLKLVAYGSRDAASLGLGGEEEDYDDIPDGDEVDDTPPSTGGTEDDGL